MNELLIVTELQKWFVTADYKLTNVFIYDWESDFFCVTKSGYTIEVEVKISRADFKADAQKTQKHFLMRNAEKELVTMPGSQLNDHYCYVHFVKPFAPNKFYYCCPEDMIKPEEVPGYAGLLYFKHKRQETWRGEEYFADVVEQAKPAKWLHKKTPDISKILLDKFYNKYIDMRYEYNMLLHHIRRMQQQYNPDLDMELKPKHEDTPTFYQQKLFDYDGNN